jgi:hypothetical protein
MTGRKWPLRGVEPGSWLVADTPLLTQSFTKSLRDCPFLAAAMLASI